MGYDFSSVFCSNYWLVNNSWQSTEASSSSSCCCCCSFWVSTDTILILLLQSAKFAFNISCEQKKKFCFLEAKKASSITTFPELGTFLVSSSSSLLLLCYNFSCVICFFLVVKWQLNFLSIYHQTVSLFASFSEILSCYLSSKKTTGKYKLILLERE